MTTKDKELEPNKPYIVRSHDVMLDAEYAEWMAEVKHRYRSAQVKAAVKVNGEKLLFNWQMGRDLVQKKAEERWGVGVVEQVSLDLKREFPNEDGFSARNLRYMKQWYLYYTTEASKLQRPVAEILHQPGAEIGDGKLHQLGAELIHQADGEFPLPFALVPWRHHVEIVTRSKSIEEALFYIGKNHRAGA